VMDEIVWRPENQPEGTVPEAVGTVQFSASEAVEPL
jgi:hypothetical protein